MQVFQDATDAIKRELKSTMIHRIQGGCVSETDGVLDLGIEARELIKKAYIKPHMPNFIEFLAALKANDDLTIERFEDKVADKMERLESNIALDIVESL